MLDLLFGKKQSLIGVEIGASVVRVLELSRSNGEYIVDCYACVPLPEKAVQGKAFKDEDAIVDVLKEAVFTSGTKAKQAVVSVSDSTVISKVIQLEEGISETEAEELVVLEADKYIPFSIEDVSIDFQILGPSDNKSGMNDILVVASRAENINARVNLLGQCGLETCIVDVESFAIQRSFLLFKDLLINQGEDKLVAVFDIGEFRTQLTVLENNQIIFTQEEEFGGRQLTESIAEKYNYSHQQAAEAKISGNLPENFNQEVLEPYLEMVVIQIKRVLQYFLSTTQYSEVEQVVLAGGAAKTMGLCEKVSSTIDVPTHLANPIANMKLGSKVDKVRIKADASGLMTVCGLALRKFKDD